jgi:dihydroorotase
MGSLCIRNGRVIDPSQGMDRVTSIRIEDGRISTFDAVPGIHDRIIDASGCVVAPGLIDLQVELREPGCEEDETIETGTAAAIAGGYTSIACLPNTDPPIDTQASVEFVRQKAARAHHCNVFVIACVSKNREGKELAEIGSLVEAGAVGFSDAGRPIQNAELLRRALEYCLMFDKPIFSHPEMTELTHGGIMHEGMTSLVLGLAGMPAAAEDLMVGRDLRLAESTGGRIHLIDISSAGSVELIRRAKARGLHVSASICMPNLVFTDERLRSFDANYKVNPPLRSQEHLDACVAGLADDTIEVIASGHAPRASEKKMRELDQAPFGMISLETTLSLVITRLIDTGLLDWTQAIAKLSTNPARVLGLKSKGSLRIGADADVVVIDPEATWLVDAQRFRSRSSNTPLIGSQLKGRAIHVIVAGEVKL